MRSDAIGRIRTFSDVFGNFQKNSDFFVFLCHVRMFLGGFIRVWMFSDVLGHVRICSDGFRSVLIHSGDSEAFCEILRFF